MGQQTYKVTLTEKEIRATLRALSTYIETAAEDPKMLKDADLGQVVAAGSAINRVYELNRPEVDVPEYNVSPWKKAYLYYYGQ